MKREALAWIPLFLEQLLRQARAGQVNIKVAAECSGVSEINVHKFRCSGSAVAKAFRAEIEQIVLVEKRVKDLEKRRRRDYQRHLDEEKKLWQK